MDRRLLKIYLCNWLIHIPFYKHFTLKPYKMIRNFFVIAWRNITKNKIFSFINIAGLGIGMACTIMIFLWVQYEKSWNKTQQNYNRVFVPGTLMVTCQQDLT